MKNPPCSIIIPTLNESLNILNCIQNVRECLPECELIVVDGGSEDDTVALAGSVDVQVITSSPGRGLQCRAGAEMASSDVLLFLHVDSVLREGTLGLLNQYFTLTALQVATFKVFFDGPEKRYRFFEWAARYDSLFTTYGDQVIVVKRDFYFNQVEIPAIALFEDVEFFRKARRKTKIHKLNIPVLTSVRRYKKKGFYQDEPSEFFTYDRIYFGSKSLCSSQDIL